MGRQGVVNMSVTIWHNPRCTKSRQTLEMLRDRGIEPEIVEYLKQKPSEKEIADAQTKLGITTRDMMRKGEDAYRMNDLKDVEDEAVLIKAMADEPILIERPIVFDNGKARIGRPPEDVLEIL